MNLFALALIIIKIKQAISQIISLEIDNPPQYIVQTEEQIQLQIENSNKTQGYYNIEISNIKYNQSSNSKQQLRLIVLVTSEKINPQISWQGALNLFPKKITADYDNFIMKSPNQKIKYHHNTTNQIIINAHFVNIINELADLKEIHSVSYEIKVTIQQNNYCSPNCQSGVCSTSAFQCQCNASNDGIIFDRACSLAAKKLYPYEQDIISTKSFMSYRYVDLYDNSQGSAIRVYSSNSGNKISFHVYQQTDQLFSVPNLLSDQFSLEASSFKEFYFSPSWQKNAAAFSVSQSNPNLKIIIAFYNFNDSLTEFKMTFYDTETGIFFGELPDWALYFFAVLVIAAVALIVTAIISFAQQYRQVDQNPRHVRPIPIQPLTTEIIQKYMPLLKYSDVAKERKVEQNECMICLEDYADDQNVRLTVCSHLFHQECIDSWLLKHKSCPYCRFELSEKEMEQKGEESRINQSGRMMTQEELHDELKKFREQMKQVDKNSALNGIIHKESALVIKQSRKQQNVNLNASTILSKSDLSETKQVIINSETERPFEVKVEDKISGNDMNQVKKSQKDRRNHCVTEFHITNPNIFHNENIHSLENQIVKTEDHEISSGNHLYGFGKESGIEQSNKGFQAEFVNLIEDQNLIKNQSPPKIQTTQQQFQFERQIERKKSWIQQKISKLGFIELVEDKQ